MGASLIAESSIWYTLTWLVVAARVGSRKIQLGTFRKLQTDDALMFLAVATDTVLHVALNILYDKNSNLIDPKHPPSLTPEDIAERTLGSKLVLVSEQMQILTTWLVKTCLLLMYSRLSFNSIQKLSVKIVAGYVAFGFVLMEILYFAVWCRPFSQYWAVPPDSIQCSAATNHLITNAVLNISSDIFIIIIPMPIFIQTNLPPQKKVILCFVFALGLFTIGAAVANKFYSFSEPYGSSWTYWYIRESSTALIVANVPFLWTTLRFAFNLHSFHGGPTSKKTDVPAGLGAAYGHNSRYVKHNTTISRGSRGLEFAADFTPLDSQEDIKFYNIPLKIYKRQEVHITSEIGDAVLEPNLPNGYPPSQQHNIEHISFNI
ncbi:hypothetical protein HD806DRAFT_490848 [Xylariaceae sp. AK1471]|nr:hypothetical protein HD806DRAFT_490848 [Xylariaceae sp. AK1471]